MFTRIVFFGALPMIFAGLRIALAVAFIVLVAAEFVATKVGIGYMIWNSWELLQVDTMFVGIVMIGLLGLDHLGACLPSSSARSFPGRPRNAEGAAESCRRVSSSAIGATIPA